MTLLALKATSIHEATCQRNLREILFQTSLRTTLRGYFDSVKLLCLERLLKRLKMALALSAPCEFQGLGKDRLPLSGQASTLKLCNA